MTTRLALRALPLLGITVLSSGCGALLGLDEFTEGATTSTATSSGTGGSGGMSTSSSTGGSGGTGGSATFCMPGKSIACYTGTAASQNTGACHDGSKTCLPDGSAYGTCTGDVTPVLNDDCTTKTDNNCDGITSCACAAGEIVDCYDGAPGTEDVGTCKGGKKQCAADGQSFGACSAQVLPAGLDDCLTVADDNCDGVVNDLCTCPPSTVATCYGGPAGTQDVGTCKAGTKVCDATGTSYGACTGDVQPAMADDCATTSLDENCDGVVNDLCACTPGTGQPCYAGPAGTMGKGTCVGGTKTCNATGTGYDACVGEVLPAATDDCNTPADENCDGVSNDACSCVANSVSSCYSGSAATLGVGACKAGTRTCDATGTGYSACTGETLPAASDDCMTAADENCDGVVNDLCTCTPSTTTSCYSGPAGTQSVGTCKPGTKTCNATGTGYGSCTGQVVPAAIDNCATALDENCDGVVNDLCTCGPNTTATCYTGPNGTQGVGTCSAGTKLCNGTGTAYGACTGQVLPAATDDCMTPADENCDGVPNDACACVANSTASCYSGPAATVGVGTCKAGTRTCNANGTAYGPCMGEVIPAAIDNCATTTVDENCDGVVNDLCTCAPNSNLACYTGPAGTQGVGICKAGSKQCNATGTAYGACTGQTLPATEVCSAIGDENCDGIPCSENVWSFLAGDSSNQYASSVAIDSSGNILVAGTFDGTLKFLNKANNTSILLNTAGSNDFYLAKFNANGDVLWAKSFGNAADNGSTIGVAVDASGNVAISGGLLGAANFGGGLVTSSGSTETLFVVKYNSAGTHLWTKSFAASAARAPAIAFDSAGDVIIGGTSIHAITIGATTFADTGAYDALVAKFAGATGTPVWAKQFKEQAGQSNGKQNISHLTVDAGNNIYIAGQFDGSIFLTASYDAGFGFDVDAFAAKLDSTGILSWAKIIDTGNSDDAYGVALDSSLNVVVTGDVGGSFNFGGGAIPGGAFIAKYTNAGNYINAKTFSTGAIIGATLDLADNIYVTINAQYLFANPNLGGGPLTIAGGYDILLGKFDSGLNHIWSKNFGDAQSQFASALRFDKSSNRLVLAGSVAGNVNFGTGLLTGASTSTYDFALAKFYP